jgi:hypothetical protein
LLFSTTEDPLDSTLPSFFSQYPNLLFYSRRNKTLNSNKQQQQQQRRKENNGKNTDTILRPSFKTPPRQTKPNKKASAKLPSRNRPHEPNSRREKKRERERERERERARRKLQQTSTARGRRGGDRLPADGDGLKPVDT